MDSFLFTLFYSSLFVYLVRDEFIYAVMSQVIPFMRLDVIKRNGISLSFACMGLPSYADYPADGTHLTATGETRLMPDLSTKRIVPWYKTSTIILLFLSFGVTILAFNS